MLWLVCWVCLDARMRGSGWNDSMTYSVWLEGRYGEDVPPENITVKYAVMRNFCLRASSRVLHLRFAFE